MPKYDLLPDQNHYQIRIGIEWPITEMLRCFFVHGQARLGLPRVTVGEFCTSLTPPAQFLAGDEVPLIYLRRGLVHFGSARWGAIAPDGGHINVQQADGRSVGYPALIPATFVDLALSVAAPSEAPTAVRLRSGAGVPLFIASAFKNDTFGNAQTVFPIVCNAGDDIARYIEWQPVLLPIAGPPTMQHFDFLSRRGQSRLLVPSDSRVVKAQIISLSADADAC